MPTSNSTIQVQKMYIAYYGRPGDVRGLEYWANILDQNDGKINVLVDSFGDSKEYTDNYTHLGSIGLISSLYQQILSRSPDQGGYRFTLIC